MWLIDVSMLTDCLPCEFDANAKALSANAYVIEPCAMPKPLVISSRTVIDNTLLPADTSSTEMPRHWLKASLSNILLTISRGVMKRTFCCHAPFCAAAGCNGNGLRGIRCTDCQVFRRTWQSRFRRPT